MFMTCSICNGLGYLSKQDTVCTRCGAKNCQIETNYHSSDGEPDTAEEQEVYQTIWGAIEPTNEATKTQEGD